MSEIKRYRCCGPSDDMFTIYPANDGPFMHYAVYITEMEKREKDHAAEVERLTAEIENRNAQIAALGKIQSEFNKATENLLAENAALTRALDEATFVEEREKITARVVEDPFMPLTATYVAEFKGIVIERDYSRLTPASRALCERLFEEENR